MTNKEILNKINEATVQVNKGNKLREAEKMIQQVEKLWNN